jgi:hypothetical protein
MLLMPCILGDSVYSDGGMLLGIECAWCIQVALDVGYMPRSCSASVTDALESDRSEFEAAVVAAAHSRCTLHQCLLSRMLRSVL